MKAFKRSPEVEEAVNRFEELSGFKVWKARRYTGSMKGYVQFVFEGTYKDFTIIQHERNWDKDYKLGNCLITYHRSLDYAGGKYIGKMAVDVRWEDLGMHYNNAYMPKVRTLNSMMV